MLFFSVDLPSKHLILSSYFFIKIYNILLVKSALDCTLNNGLHNGRTLTSSSQGPGFKSGHCYMHQWPEAVFLVVCDPSMNEL